MQKKSPKHRSRIERARLDEPTPAAVSPKSPSPSRDIELERFVGLDEAARLRGVSVNFLKRNFPELIQQISRNRLGMRLYTL